MSDKALTVVPQSLDTMALGKVLAGSGYFQDAKDVSQAIVKVLAGQELGLGPIASMTGIYIVKGRVTLSANIMAAAVKRSGKYDYRIKRLDDQGCELEFYEGQKVLGASKFDEADAKAAQLSGGDNWKKYPRNMYFARAMSNGAKWYCPDIFAGPVYTPDELGATVDGETGEILDVKAMEVTSPLPAAEVSKSEPPQSGNGHDAEKLTPANPEAAKRDFYDRVLKEIPYYRADQHIASALKELGFKVYKFNDEAAMFAALQAHATAKADEEAAGA